MHTYVFINKNTYYVVFSYAFVVFYLNFYSTRYPQYGNYRFSILLTIAYFIGHTNLSRCNDAFSTLYICVAKL